MSTTSASRNDEDAYAGWFDELSEISPAVIKSREYKALVLPDIFNPLESEWIAESFGIGNKVDILIAEPIVESYKIRRAETTRDSILKLLFDSISYNLLVGDQSNGYFFKSYSDRYTLLFGTDSFLQQSWRGTVDTAKMMYFNYWADDFGKDSYEYKYLLRVWNKYSKFFPTERN